MFQKDEICEQNGSGIKDEMLKSKNTGMIWAEFCVSNKEGF